MPLNLDEKLPREATCKFHAIGSPSPQASTFYNAKMFSIYVGYLISISSTMQRSAMQL